MPSAILLALSTALAAPGGDPVVHVSWRGADSTFWVRAPQGEHVAEDAPFDVSLTIGDRILAISGMGEDLVPGLPLGDVRGEALSGVVSASMCEDGGTRCRLVEVHVEGTASKGARGSLTLAVSPYDGPPPEPMASTAPMPSFPRQIDAQAAHDEARQDAIARGVPLLLDFGAVWCPPCQRLDAEVFFAEPRPSVVDGVSRAWIDVDDPSSWALKDRYAVGGYPTLVAVDAKSGEAIGRLVGYPGPQAAIAWLDEVVTGVLEADLTDPSPVQASQAAWRAVMEGRMEDAASLLDVAQRAPEEVSFRLARFHVSPNLEDARWLAERAPDRALSWVGALRGPLREDPEARAVVIGAAQAGLKNASAAEAADLLSVAAELTEDPLQRKLLYGAAARSLEGALTGDVARDKGHLGWMAWLEEHAGFPEKGLGRLEAARATFSNEPTFHLSTARMLLRLGMPAEAKAAAQAALETSWGDNTLQAATVLAEAMVALGQQAEAQEMADEVLGRLPAPADDLDVRTRRMRAALRDVVSGDAD